ncbi:MAG: vanadium-dependent haloperoxidase [Flavobacteriaceae bacterium]|nr:vanadium-dependent haloperoxidase [Flavobacteriaceae bacterium]
MTPEAYDADVAIGWNELLMKIAVAEDGLLTLKGVRTQAMMFTTMHDALNAIEGRYTSYAKTTPHPTADPLSAAAQAAFHIALDQYPDKKTELEEELAKWIEAIPDSEAKEEGIQLGKAVAQRMLEARNNDAFNGEASYNWHPMAPGVYAEFNEHSGTPEGFIFGAGWAQAQPFLLTSQDQFRSPAPPGITTDAYTEAFHEVKEWGSTESTLRTADQAHLAMWWKDFVESSHNRLARALIQKEELNLWEAARTFALLNMTIYDAYVNVFDNKFHYNHWRPYTAIRWAANDDNPNTAPDEAWNNLHKHTYAFPSYPSAHGTASSAAMRVLANTLGTGDDYAFTMHTDIVDSAGPFSEPMVMDPPTRSFTSFSQAGLEASLSRIYLGIHFRYDSEEGHRLGNSIGDYANTNFLLPLTVEE